MPLGYRRESTDFVCQIENISLQLLYVIGIIFSSYFHAFKGIYVAERMDSRLHGNDSQDLRTNTICRGSASVPTPIGA
jgi:hypothetical protein